MTIRSAGDADAEMLARVGAQLFQATFAADNDPMDMYVYLSDAFTTERQRAELADPDRICLLAEEGAASVGYALLRHGAAHPHVMGAQPIEIQRFYIDRAWHGRGLAARLMAACLGAARERGAETVWLGVWERNPRAIRFYEKHGFTDVGSQEFRLGTDLQTDRVMTRPVGGQLMQTA
ncbi:MAG: GNAT family N-acetyltransferase [Gemmatimonadota bacterium]|nr:GNAT family N-acetyltransferase [Gemmatimonadota bacterium]